MRQTNLKFWVFWESCFLGRKFWLRCDSSQRKHDKFICWFDRLSRFDFDFEYIIGASNCVADCLSRLPASSQLLAILALSRNRSPLPKSPRESACWTYSKPSKATVTTPSCYTLSVTTDGKASNCTPTLMFAMRWTLKQNTASSYAVKDNHIAIPHTQYGGGFYNSLIEVTQALFA